MRPRTKFDAKDFLNGNITSHPNAKALNLRVLIDSGRKNVRMMLAYQTKEYCINGHVLKLTTHKLKFVQENSTLHSNILHIHILNAAQSNRTLFDMRVYHMYLLYPRYHVSSLSHSSLYSSRLFEHSVRMHFNVYLLYPVELTPGYLSPYRVYTLFCIVCGCVRALTTTAFLSHPTENLLLIAFHT